MLKVTAWSHMETQDARLGCMNLPGVRHCTSNFNHTKRRGLPCLQSLEQGDDAGMVPSWNSRGTSHSQGKLRVENSSFWRQLEKRGSKEIAILRKFCKLEFVNH